MTRVYHAICPNFTFGHHRTHSYLVWLAAYSDMPQSLCQIDYVDNHRATVTDKLGVVFFPRRGSI